SALELPLQPKMSTQPRGSSESLKPKVKPDPIPMMSALEILLLVPIVGSLFFYLACAFFTQQFFSTAPQASKIPPYNPGVSLLVPVRGLDEGAWENWSSLCSQDYPEYEVLFGVMEPSDPAIPVLRQVVAAFPDRAHLFVDLPPRGLNFKDSNLSYLLERSCHQVIVFADSDIQVDANYLHTVTDPLADKSIGMVTCCFTGRNPRSIGAALAALGRCCDFIPSFLIAQAMDQGLRCAVGATIAMRRDVLEEIGGLHLNRIGSDYNIGKRTAEAGYRVELSHYVLESDTGNESTTAILQRELRWARTIRFNRGAVYYTMIFCYGTVFCWPLLLVSGFASWAINLTLFVFAVRYLQATIAIRKMQGWGLLRWLWLLPWRDGLSLWVWLRGSVGQKVNWRGRWLEVKADGLLAPMDWKT
ncbi:MAG TPA: glycosyltransferase, partial [Thermosynechococcaceae cyanobacterium]